MGDASKLLDTVIKAPLWFFFAAMVFTGAPMFNIPNLVEVGVRSDMRIASVPLALYALASASLFLSSAIARCLPVIRGAAAAVGKATWWSWRLMSLPEEARAILAVQESDGSRHFYYDPQSSALSALRDAGIVHAEYVSSDGRDWGKYSMRDSYRRACFRRPGLFRRALQVEKQALEDVRAREYVAQSFASRRV